MDSKANRELGPHDNVQCAVPAVPGGHARKEYSSPTLAILPITISGGGPGTDNEAIFLFSS